MVVFALIDVVPHIVTREAPRGPKNFQSSTKRDFFNSIGAKSSFRLQLI